MSESGTLCRLIYVSRNALVGTASEMEKEVTRVLEVSRRNNGRDGITGALLFNGDCFAQMLEGAPAAVHRVFERIQLDPRHRESVVIDYAVVEEREFGNWSMAYAGRVPEEQARYAALAGDADRAATPGRVMALLHEVVDRTGA